MNWQLAVKSARLNSYGMFQPNGPNFLLSWDEQNFCYMSFPWNWKLISSLSLWRKAAGFKTTQTTKLGLLTGVVQMLKQCQQSERLTFHFGTCPNNIISCQLKHYILQKKLNLNNRVQESNRVQKNWPGWLVAKTILVTKMLLLNVKSRVFYFLPIVECVLRYVSVCTTQTRPF